ncbi:hypothetical protein NOGI109294_04120 [Nocardiopsis gilva]
MMLKKMAAAGIIAATATTMFAATPASAAEAATKGTVRFSFGCNGSTKARANFSYNEGTVSTTVYYNNHCSHSVRVTVNMADASGLSSHGEARGSSAPPPTVRATPVTWRRPLAGRRSQVSVRPLPGAPSLCRP